jgi:hypothetical protein
MPQDLLQAVQSGPSPRNPGERFAELCRFRCGNAAPPAEAARALAVETWELLVLWGMYSSGEGRLSLAPFKGGSCLRLFYGSERRSMDLDFDAPPEDVLSDDPEDEAEAADPRVLLDHAKTRLERASAFLAELGIEAEYRPVKAGDGTVRLKVCGRAWLGGHPLEFVSKVEISRRRKAGLEEVARVHGTEVLFRRVPLDSPLWGKVRHLAGSPLETWAVCYTPLAVFLEKLSAVANSLRPSPRDVYDLCFLYRRHLAEDPRLAPVLRTYLSAELAGGKLDGFVESLRDKAGRFAAAVEDGLDAFGTADGMAFDPGPGFDPVGAGLDVLEFASEMETLWKTALEGLER